MSLLRFEVRGRPAEPAVAWNVLGDTDWMNRVAGNGRLLEMEHVDDREGLPRLVGRFEGALGRTPSFEEVHSSWVYRRRFLQVRTWEGGLIDRSSYEMRLEPAAEGVLPRVTLEVVPRPGVAGTLCKIGMSRFRKAWQGVVDRLPAPGRLRPDVPFESRALEPEVERLLGRWAESAAAPALAEQVGAFLRTARPIELAQIRPFVLADRLGLDREETLGALLRGVVGGLFELGWSIRCPLCHGQVARAELLEDVSPDAACPTCRVAFECDLERTIEAVLSPHPSLRLRPEETFCTLFPAAAPSMYALFLVEPGRTEADVLPLAPGHWRVSAGNLAPERLLHAVADPDAASSLVVSTAPDGEAAREVRVRAGDVALRLENPGAAFARFVVTAAGTDDDRVTGLRLATFPEFRRLMGHQVLSPGMKVRVRQVAILFTDLTSSVAFYKRLGDAEAWAFVRDHLAFLSAAIEREGGVVVKTVGDALMAAFDDPVRAVAAALRMHESFPAWLRSQTVHDPPSLRVAGHAGPCLAVRSAASGIDFFGMTVNVASRLEKLSTGDDVILSEALAGAPGVAELLAPFASRTSSHETRPKGLDHPIGVLRVRGDTAPSDPLAGKS